MTIDERLHGTIKLWKTADGHLIRTFTGHRKDVFSVAFHPQGHLVASGGWDHQVKLWRMNEDAPKTLPCHLGSVFQVHIAPNGKYLVAAGAGGRLQFWDLQTEQTFLYLYAFDPEAWLALLPDGRFDGSPSALPYLRYTEKNTLKSCAAEDLAREFHDPKAIEEVMSNYLAR